jgi:SAM-dependent methyltransferase
VNIDADSAGWAQFYVCANCKAALVATSGDLRCEACDACFSVIDDIPEFVAGDLSASPDPQLRRMRFIDKMAGLYESQLWYPVVMKLFGGLRAPLLPQLLRSIADILEPVDGPVLDVACGPGTFGRKIVRPTREVWGIDVSRGMLRQGAAFAAAERVANLHFARARVEALPFGDAAFDAVICCGSLHLFTDTVVALKEMARVMKPGAVLAAFTFTPGDGGLLKYESFRRRSRARHGLHVFTLDELRGDLARSGFEDFRPEVAGSVVTFGARKRHD